MIKKWHLKSFVQKCISFLPWKEKANFLFQKYVTKGVELSESYFGYKIQHASDHLSYYNQYSTLDFSKARCLELGTGWYPVVPISFFLSGCHEVISIDIYKWYNKKSLIATLEKFRMSYEASQLQNFLKKIQPDRWATLLEIINHKETIRIEEILVKLRFKPMLQDAQSTSFEAESFDLICSNNTFEHVYSTVLKNILVEFKRIAKSASVMSHFIDMTDHFEHFDKSINIYNFLQYTEKQWARIDNSIQPQNRLRFKDYIQMYRDLDINICAMDSESGSMDELEKVNLSDAFKVYSKAELLVSHGYIVSKI